MADARGPLRIYYFTFYASMAVYLPYFPAWLREHGIDGLSMSVLLALLPTMNVFGPPAFGLLADTLGLRGRLLRWAAAGAAVSFVPLMMYAWLSGTISFPVVFATCLGFAFFRTPMNLMADVVALEQGEDFSRLRLWGSLGFMMAVPVVGHYLNLALTWGLPALMALLLCLSQVTTLRMPDQGKVPRRAVFKDVRTVLADRGFLAFCCAACFGQAAHVGYDMVLSMHLHDLGMSGAGVGWAWSLATASEIGVLAYAPRFSSSGNAARLLLLALLVQALRWMLMSVVTDHAWLLVMQGLHAVSFGLRWVACMLIVARVGQRIGAVATIQGLHLTATSLGSVIGMFIAGALFEAHGGAWVFVVSAGLALGAAAFALVYALLPADGFSKGAQENAA